MCAFAVNAVRIVPTRQYLIAPEVEARFIRFSTQEVEVVLTDEVLRCVERVNGPAR